MNRKRIRRLILIMIAISLLLIPGDSAGDATTEKVLLGEKSGKIAPQTALLFEM